MGRHCHGDVSVLDETGRKREESSSFSSARKRFVFNAQRPVPPGWHDTHLNMNEAFWSMKRKVHV